MVPYIMSSMRTISWFRCLSYIITFCRCRIYHVIIVCKSIVYGTSCRVIILDHKIVRGMFGVIVYGVVLSCQHHIVFRYAMLRCHCVIWHVTWFITFLCYVTCIISCILLSLYVVPLFMDVIIMLSCYDISCYHRVLYNCLSYIVSWCHGLIS